MRVLSLLYSNPAPLLTIAEASLQWTPQIAISHEAVFLEIGKCRKLYREPALLSRLRALNQQLGFKPKVAIANDLPTALAMARFQVPRRELLPVEALSDYFSPWAPTDTLHLMISLLKKVGVDRLVDFLKLPAASLSSRFGKEGVLVIQKINQAARLPWPLYVLPEIIVEKMALDPFETTAPVTQLEPLIFVTKRLIDRAMARLKRRGGKASVIELIIEQEPYSTIQEPKRRWPIHLSIPQGETSGLLPIIKDRLEADLKKEPLAAPITAVSFQVLESTPANEAERDFFNKQEEEEGWCSLVARLSEKLGRERVFIASPVERYLPEKSWRKSLKPSGKASPPLPPRPLRLLKSPKEVAIRGKMIFSGKKHWEVAAVEGPERISGEWWVESFERDYFKVRSHSGEVLWIFKNVDLGKYYLHGIFD
jgi:protein ImuB